MAHTRSITKRAQKAVGKRIGAAAIDLVLWFILFQVAVALFGTMTTRSPPV